MRILVTGGSGYIGSQLAQALLEEGHTVRLLDVRPSRADKVAFAMDFIEGNVADRAKVAEALRGIDVVYHLAWSFRHDDPGHDRGQNVWGTLCVLDASLAAGVQHFHFASSAVVYGPTGPIPATEERVCHPERSTIGGPLYGITKLACERHRMRYLRRGLPVTVWRIHGVLSAGRLGQFGRMAQRAREGKTICAARGAGGEYVHLDDAVAVLVRAAHDQRAVGEVFNLAGDWRYLDTDLAHDIARLTRPKGRVECFDDPGQTMISVTVGKLCRSLGYAQGRGEFLSDLIRNSLR